MMRITGNADMGAATLNKANAPSVQPVKVMTTLDSVVEQGGEATTKSNVINVEQSQQLNNEDEVKVKVQEVVEKMNQMLEVSNKTAKFKYHEGLDRFYVTVVDRDTDEVIKEIPAKKLLDAFYEMQKMFGMIVDEKI